MNLDALTVVVFSKRGNAIMKMIVEMVQMKSTAATLLVPMENLHAQILDAYLCLRFVYILQVVCFPENSLFFYIESSSSSTGLYFVFRSVTVLMTVRITLLRMKLMTDAHVI